MSYNEHYDVCQSMKLDTQQKSMKPQYIKMSFLPSMNKEITIKFTFMLKKLWDKNNIPSPFILMLTHVTLEMYFMR